MNLDDMRYFEAIDPENYLGRIDELPRQLEDAWALGGRMPLPDAYRGVRQVAVLGMGGSAIGGSLLEAFAAPQMHAGLSVLRGYDLPAHIAGPETLVIASSYSGNTEETLSGFEQAARRGVRLLAIATGGELVALAEGAGAPAWTFVYKAQPRAAVGYSFGLLLAVVARLGLLPDPEPALMRATAALRAQMASIGARSPVAGNPAKRLAGQLMDRYPVIFGADLLAPVARRWKGQINEVAKAWAQFEELPEADHNTVAGGLYPEALVDKHMLLFLRATSNHPRNLRRLDATRELFMVSGYNTDCVEAAGEGALTQMFTALHFGDYTSYYLAMAYGVDPSPVPQIAELKQRLAQ